MPRRSGLRCALVLRLGAIAIVLLPVLAGVLLRALPWGVWLGTGLALVGGLALTLARPRARGLVLLGTMLAVLAGLAALPLPTELHEPTQVDLRTEPAPPGLRGPVRVTGYVRDEQSMVEFAVAEGALPQQDGPAEALLVPLLGVEDGPAPLGTVVIVARVRPGQEKAAGVQTIEGHASPLEPELLSAFLLASGVRAPAEVEGVLVDAVAGPRAPAWLLGGLVGLAMVGAMVCLALAVRGSAV